MSVVLPAKHAQLEPLVLAALEDYADEVDIGDTDTQELAENITKVVMDYLGLLGVATEG
jgi:hypothetical protein